MISAMMTNKVNLKVIDAEAGKDHGDSTLISLNADTAEELEATGDIRPGWTGPTVLFKTGTCTNIK